MATFLQRSTQMLISTTGGRSKLCSSQLNIARCFNTSLAAHIRDTALPRFNTLDEAMSYVSTKTENNGGLSSSLEALGVLASKMRKVPFPERRDAMNTTTFRRLLGAVSSAIPSMNSSAAKETLLTFGRYGPSAPGTPGLMRELQDVIEPLLERLYDKKINLETQDVGGVLLGVAQLGLPHPRKRDFFQEAVAMFAPHMGVLACCQSLKAIRLFDSRAAYPTAKPILDRLSQSTSLIMGNDIAPLMTTFAATGLSDQSVVRHCLTLLTDHLDLLQAYQIREAVGALTKMKAIRGWRLVKAVERISPKFPGTRSYLLGDFLYDLSFAGKENGELDNYAAALVNAILLQPIEEKKLALKTCFGICAYGLKSKKTDLATLLDKFAPTIRPNQEELVRMLHDILLIAESEFKVKPRINDELKGALASCKCGDPLHPSAIGMLVSTAAELQGKFKLNLQTKVQIGAIEVAAADPVKKIAIDIDAKWPPVSRMVRNRYLENNGYSVAQLPLSRLPKEKRPAEANLRLLQSGVLEAFVQSGAMTQDEARETRELLRTPK